MEGKSQLQTDRPPSVPPKLGRNTPTQNPQDKKWASSDKIPFGGRATPTTISTQRSPNSARRKTSFPKTQLVHRFNSPYGFQPNDGPGKGDGHGAISPKSHTVDERSLEGQFSGGGPQLPPRGYEVQQRNGAVSHSPERRYLNNQR